MGNLSKPAIDTSVLFQRRPGRSHRRRDSGWFRRAGHFPDHNDGAGRLYASPFRHSRPRPRPMTSAQSVRWTVTLIRPEKIPTAADSSHPAAGTGELSLVATGPRIPIIHLIPRFQDLER